MDSIIFDVDGTLWDSTGLVAKAWTEVFARETNYHMIFTSDTLQALFGRTLPAIANILMPELSKEKQIAIIDKCCEAEHEALLASTESMTFQGLEETLEHLYQKYPLFLVSNCQAGYIDIFLKVNGLSRYFQDALCPGDTGLGKAENIKTIVQKHQLKSPIYVGDTLGDEKAAHSAGLPFVFASYGFGLAENPEYTISSIGELPRLTASIR